MGPNFIAGGTINEARFVTPMHGTPNAVVQSVSGDVPMGISGRGTRRDPDPDFAAGSSALALAIANDPVEVFTLGEYCQLMLGGSCNPGDFLKPDANGQGIVSNTVAGQAYGARATEGGVAGQLVRVQVMIGADL